MTDPLLPVEAAIGRRPELHVDARICLNGVPTLIVSGPSGQGVVRTWEEFEERFGTPDRSKRCVAEKLVPSGATKQLSLF